MAVPKKRQTRSHKGQRRSHHGVARLSLISCPRCKKPVPSHVACPNCGTYKGRDVIDVLAKLSKKEQKRHAKEHNH